MTQKPVDTIKMVRAIRDAHYTRLQGKSVAERLAYYRECAKRMNTALADGTTRKVV